MRGLLALCLVWSASAAFAQDADAGVAPEVIDAGIVSPPPAALTARQRRAGNLGVGFLGTVPVLRAMESTTTGTSPGPITITDARATVPMIGVRWWSYGSLIGVELGIGFMYSEGQHDSSSASSMNVSQYPITMEFVGHAALPLSIVSTENVIIFVSPEFRLGNSSRAARAAAKPDVAWTIDAGLRAGIEIFFGFIGIDRLSLEIAARIGVTHEIRTLTTQAALDEIVDTTHLTRISTSLMGNPWDIVTSAFALRYYF